MAEEATRAVVEAARAVAGGINLLKIYLLFKYNK